MTETRALLAAAARQLAEAGVASPTTDAEILLSHVLGVSRGNLLLVWDVAEVHENEFRGLVALRASRVPLQHLTGSTGFRYVELEVGAGVFTPRPETELLAGWAIDIDHLLATPIYSAGRCSLGFHPLHTLPAIVLYATLMVAKPLRLLGLGLLIHIALDGIDCLRMACKVQSHKISIHHEHHFQGNSVMGPGHPILLTSNLSEQSHYARMQA